MSAVEIAAGARRGALSGAIYVLAAGLCWSFTGIFLRLAPHFDPWQFLAWRSFGTACAVVIVARVSGHGPLARRLVAVGSRRCDRHVGVRCRLNYVHNLDEDDDSSQCAVLVFLRAASCGDSRLSRARRKIESLADGLPRTRSRRPLDHRQ